jgi:putative transposase
MSAYRVRHVKIGKTELFDALASECGRLWLSNGKQNATLVLHWPWDLPQTVVVHWSGTEYEAIATYQQAPLHGPFSPGKVAGIDLGEVHMAAAYDGTQTHILN